MASNKLSSERAAALAAVRESEDAAYASAVAAEGVFGRAAARAAEAAAGQAVAAEERDRAYAWAAYVAGRAEAVDEVLGLVAGTAARCQRRWSRVDAEPVVVAPAKVTVVKPRARPTAVVPAPVEDVAAVG